MEEAETQSRSKPEEEKAERTQAGQRGPPPSPQHPSVSNLAASGGEDEWQGADGLTEERGTRTPSRKQSSRQSRPAGSKHMRSEHFHCSHTHCLHQQLRDLGAQRSSVDPELWKGGVTVHVGVWHLTHTELMATQLRAGD